ncbi:glycosyltransferase family 4 protein [Roseibium algae]|uniref:Glycosyltransferase family 4 protein n=1 Tax=Roseibium algae TaxID=3123038 RepID=A0ABU8TQU7_9HYPH
MTGTIGATRGHVVFAYPGDLETRTGGYGYDRRIIAGLVAKGWVVDLLELGDGYPFPSAETKATAHRALEQLAPGTCVVVDGLAFGVLPDIAHALSDRLKFIALVHHPLCKENGIKAGVASKMETSERAALSQAARVIVTSSATGRQVQDLFGITDDRLHVVLPGTDVRSSQHVGQIDKGSQSRPSGPVQLLSVGSVAYRKGYDLLFDAIADLSNFDWHLNVVGDHTRDPECYRQLLEQLRKLELAERVTFHGTVDDARISDFYQAADIFVLASRYEGYGMAYTEALAYGLPVIGSGAGAVQETLSGGGALYCGVEDVNALRDALRRTLTDLEFRISLGAEAAEASRKLPSWDDAAADFAGILERS